MKFLDKESASKGIKKLNNFKLLNKTLIVDYAKENDNTQKELLQKYFFFFLFFFFFKNIIFLNRNSEETKSKSFRKILPIATNLG